jgi:hypothetical protein
VSQDNVPRRGAVAQGAYAYYRIQNSVAGATVVVTITVFSGDADLTVSMSPSPTLTNGTWISVASGGDSIYVPNAAAGWYYIGVYGFINATFSVLGRSAAGNDTNRLVLGVPQVRLSAAFLSLSFLCCRCCSFVVVCCLLFLW